jgi:hypothetical protein
VVEKLDAGVRLPEFEFCLLHLLSVALNLSEPQFTHSKQRGAPIIPTAWCYFRKNFRYYGVSFSGWSYDK